ncbi:MAG: ECF transporter S component [Clostridia bacterium]|nr:ECF transporter S component [Clostridia bacterium]
MNKKTQTVVGLGILTAIVIVLQALAVNVRFGAFSVTFVLAPIIIGAALYGYKAGAWLGLVFGAVVLLTDAGAFLAINVPGTIATCILKGVVAGLAAGAVYKLFEKKNKVLAVVLAGITAPVCNTGLFLVGCRLFFFETIKAWGAAAGYENPAKFMLVGFVGMNFVVELVINLVLAAAIVRIVTAVSKAN